MAVKKTTMNDIDYVQAADDIRYYGGLLGLRRRRLKQLLNQRFAYALPSERSLSFTSRTHLPRRIVRSTMSRSHRSRRQNPK